MGMDAKQLRELVELVLERAGLGGPEAVELLMLTAAAESAGGRYLRQIGGPALGIFQMEPDTERDIWLNWLGRRPELAGLVGRHRSLSGIDLQANLAYQILMARCHYLRVPDALPAASDVAGMAAYWKEHWNTWKGRGEMSAARAAYERCAMEGMR